MTDQSMREVLLEEWRSGWRSMGLAAVAEQVMARRGPAVEEPVWVRMKLEEAELWLQEELVRQDKAASIARRRATVSFWLSIFAACVSMTALVISAAPLLQKLRS